MALTPRQTAIRRTGLGGTDAGVIAGVNPFSTLGSVWAEKVYGSSDFKGSDAAWAGIVLEEPIAVRYAEEEGVELVGPFDEPMRHPVRRWQLGSPDRLVCDRRVGIDCKTSGLLSAWSSPPSGWGDPGSDMVPASIWVQCQWYLSLLDFERWDVPALVRGKGYAVYRIHPEPRFQAWLLDLGERFWVDHVLAEEPPPADFCDRGALARIFPKVERPELLEATDDDIETAAQRAKAAAAEKQWTEEKERLDNRLKRRIGDANGIEGVATWKQGTKGRRFRFNWRG